MNFLGIGMGEILLVVVIALVIFGPEKMVGIAKKAGKLMNTVKQTSADLKSQVMVELDPEEKDHRPKPEKKTK